MDLATFRLSFPEFGDGSTGTSDAIVSQALTRAASWVVESVWGEHYDEAHGLQAAVLLTDSAFAFRARPKGVDSTTYERRLETLALAVPRRGVVLHGD